MNHMLAKMQRFILRTVVRKLEILAHYQSNILSKISTCPREVMLYQRLQLSDKICQLKINMLLAIADIVTLKQWRQR